jgi:Zn-dependent protease
MSLFPRTSHLQFLRAPWTLDTRRMLRALSRQPALNVVLTVVGYSFLGPIAALILVATLLDHEFAHRLVMRRLGYQPGPVQLLPLLGAYVRARVPMLRSVDIALVYLAGPLAGLLSAGISAVMARAFLEPPVEQQVLTGAGVSVALNLFNLIPIEPLDGGRVSRILPYPALILFPISLLLVLGCTNLLSSPIAIALVLGASAITGWKVLRWRHYLHDLRVRVRHGDLAALRELRLTVEVPWHIRLLVAGIYVLLIPLSLAWLAVLFPASGFLG